MKARIANARTWLPCLLLTACGPTVGESGDADPSGTSEAPTTTTTATGSTVTPTSADTTAGPVDSGGVETSAPQSDFPEFCSLIEQDCPPGYKCSPYIPEGESGWYRTRCIEIAPDPSGVDEPCTAQSPTSGIDDCDGTSMCWYVDEQTNEGTCVPFCLGPDLSNPTCPDPCDYCTIQGDGLLTICLDSCDPLAQDCAAGQACYPDSLFGVFVCAPDASPEGAGIGSPCEFINVCPPGQACVNGSSVPGCDPAEAWACCVPFCAVGGADPCPGLLPGTECVPWFPEGSRPPEACVAAPAGVCVIPEA